MAVSSRRALEKQERAESILDAAEQVFFNRGFSQSTMDEIAQKVGLSRSLLYVYYKDKSAIMRGVMLRAAEELERRFAAALAAGRTGLEQIEGIGLAYYAFSKDASDYFDVLTDMSTFPMPAQTDEDMQQLGCCRQKATELMVQALQNGLRDGSLDPQQVRDPFQTAFYLQGALHGVIMMTRSPVPAAQYPDGDGLVMYSMGMLSESMRSKRAK